MEYKLLNVQQLDVEQEVYIRNIAKIIDITKERARTELEKSNINNNRRLSENKHDFKEQTGQQLQTIIEKEIVEHKVKVCDVK